MRSPTLHSRVKSAELATSSSSVRRRTPARRANQAALRLTRPNSRELRLGALHLLLSAKPSAALAGAAYRHPLSWSSLGDVQHESPITSRTRPQRLPGFMTCPGRAPTASEVSLLRDRERAQPPGFPSAPQWNSTARQPSPRGSTRALNQPDTRPSCGRPGTKVLLGRDRADRYSNSRQAPKKIAGAAARRRAADGSRGALCLKREVQEIGS